MSTNVHNGIHTVYAFLSLDDDVVTESMGYWAYPYDVAVYVSAEHTYDLWCTDNMDTAVEVLSHILTSSVWLDLISKNMLCHI